MAIINDVKTMLGLSADSSAELTNKLNIIISGAESQLLSYLPSDTESVPEALEYIVTELAIARFNRIGNENMSSYSQDGESISYAESDIAPYLKAIKAYNERHSKEGVVRFI